MRIAILTQPLGHNYGGLLQNFALQYSLRKMGHEAVTIDQQEIKTPRIARVKHDLKTFILKVFGLGAKRAYSGYSPTIKEIKTFRRNTDLFIEKNIKCTKPISSKRAIVKLSKEYNFDAYVVGSDQCWRPRYNRFIEFMFLSFLPKNSNALRLSYASSFGTDKWEFNDKLTERCKLLLSLFDHISVREKSAIELCRRYFQVEVSQVLDPTMLLSKDEYINLFNLESETSAEGDLFYYVLDPDNRKLGFVEHAAKILNYESYKVVPKYQEETRTKNDIKKHISDCVYPPVTAWLKGLLDAKMIIVDSFHGAVFSILFNKPFWVLGNKGRGNTRFDSLLTMFNLSERFVDIDNPESLNIDLCKPIDWASVNYKLDVERLKSFDYLRTALLTEAAPSNS